MSVNKNGVLVLSEGNFEIRSYFELFRNEFGIDFEINDRYRSDTVDTFRCIVLCLDGSDVDVEISSSVYQSYNNGDKSEASLPPVIVLVCGVLDIGVLRSVAGITSDYVKIDSDVKDLFDAIEKAEKVKRIEFHNFELRQEREKLLREIEEWNLELERRLEEKSRSLEEKEKRIHDFRSAELSSISIAFNFSEETLQAGLSILSYFKTVLGQKYPDMDVKVSIRQSGLQVVMLIEPPDSEKEKVESAFEDYALAITGKIPATEMLENPFHVLQFKNKLQIAELELRQSKELLAITRDNYEGRISGLEDQIKLLSAQIDEGSSREKRDHDKFKLFCAQIGVCQDSTNQMLQLIKDEKRIGTDEWAVAVEKVLEEIGRASPSSLESISKFIANTAYGVSGNATFQIIQSIMHKVFM